jgi:group I intron endonuclease
MIVYLLLNRVNLKGYVGQHKGKTLATRWNLRFNLSKVNPHLRNAIKKYGHDAFSREILNVCWTQHEMDNLEKLWIATLRTYDSRHGYNKNFGGRYCRGHTPEARQSISQAMKRVWRFRSRKQHAKAIRQWWASRTETERNAIRLKMSHARRGQKIRVTAPPWNKGLVGLPSGKKGKRYGPQRNPCASPPLRTAEHKRRIGEGIRRYWARKREIGRKISEGLKRYWARKRRKPVASTRVSPALNPRFKSTANRSNRQYGGRYACCV